jgi:4-amino-4-deoxy-L-arabinose transferase-like glycosyltransferase
LKVPSTQSRERAIAGLLLLAITLAGGLLRVYEIGSKSLWIDEAWSVWVGRQPIPDILAWLVRVDQHPPLYYLLLHFWRQACGNAVGGTLDGVASNAVARAAAARALSALFGTLNIPVIYALGRHLIGRKVGLLAALILALSPFHVWFAQEARMYALLSLNASLAMLALVHLLAAPPLPTAAVGHPDPSEWARRDEGEGFFPLPRSGSRLRDTGGRLGRGPAWAAYILFTAATLWTHNTAILFPITVNLFVLGLAWARRRWPIDRASALPPGTLLPPPLKHWIAAQVGVLLLWSPWLGPLVRQATGVYREFWLPAPTWMTVAETIHNFMSAFLPQRVVWIGVLWILYGALLLAGIRSLRRRPAVLTLLLTTFITPLAGELLVSVHRPIFYDRTLIWASVPLYLLLAAGIVHVAGQRLRRRFYALAAVMCLVALNVLSLHQYYVHYEKEQWDDAAQYVAQHAEEGDLIFFHATWAQLPFDFYFDSQHTVEKRGLPVDLLDRGILEPKMTEQDLARLYKLLGSRDRVWLIYSHNWYTDPQNLIPTALAETRQLLDLQPFHGLQVHLYDMSPN